MSFSWAVVRAETGLDGCTTGTRQSRAMTNWTGSMPLALHFSTSASFMSRDIMPMSAVLLMMALAPSPEPVAEMEKFTPGLAVW